MQGNDDFPDELLRYLNYIKNRRYSKRFPSVRFQADRNRILPKEIDGKGIEMAYSWLKWLSSGHKWLINGLFMGY